VSSSGTLPSVGGVIAATNWNELVAVGTLALAGVTAFTAGVAAFQERIRQFFVRARVAMEIRMEAPDTTQIDGTDPNTGAFTAKLLYVRIRVSHRSGRPAENVEIMVTNVWRRAGDDSWQVLQTFLPLTLAWSHVRTVSSRVPSGLFRFCDLGRFQRDDQGQTIFVFDTIVQPNPVAGGVYPNVLYPGEYRFELALGGDNTNRETGRWLLRFGSGWSDDEATMLSMVSLTPG
jgi:hypothetical protein